MDKPLEAIQTLVFMSVVVEFLLAIFRQFISKQASQLVVVVIGITLCFAYQVGIFTSLGLQTRYAFVDYLISGIIISQGSNALSELFKLRQNESAPLLSSRRASSSFLSRLYRSLKPRPR
jgi:hypothetical protein